MCMLHNIKELDLLQQGQEPIDEKVTVILL